MQVEQAIRHYQGKDGARRLNCAQSVTAAFAQTHGTTEEDIESLAGCGGGRAPGGLCGAYHAAVQLLGSETETMRDSFLEAAGALTCREIRSLRKLPCAGCVAHAARLVQEADDRRGHEEGELGQSAS